MTKRFTVTVLESGYLVKMEFRQYYDDPMGGEECQESKHYACKTFAEVQEKLLEWARK